MPVTAATARPVTALDDPFEAAKAAVSQVLTTTAEERELILESAQREKIRLVAQARQEADAIIEAAKLRSEQMLTDAEAAAKRTRHDATAIIADVRAALPDLVEIDARITSLLARARDGGGWTNDDESLVPDPDRAWDAPFGDGQRASDRYGGFLTQLARQLDALDRARSTGDRDDLGLVLQNLSNLAEGANATDLADYVRHLGPDASPEELDELTERCYRVGHSTTAGGVGFY